MTPDSADRLLQMVVNRFVGGGSDGAGVGFPGRLDSSGVEALAPNLTFVGTSFTTMARSAWPVLSSCE